MSIATGSPRTKIVATVGPACSDPQQLRDLIKCGVDIFRINTAHGSRDDHQKILEDIRTASWESRPIAVLVDLAGPKIRLDELTQDPMPCSMNEEFRFVSQASDSLHDLTTTYEPLVEELSVGDFVMLADGAVRMEVVRKEPGAAVCRVNDPGEIRSRQGVNLPGVKLSASALTSADLSNAEWAAECGADFVGLSFVRSPDDVEQLRSVLKKHGSVASIVAKIEKPEALAQLDEIVSAADAVMVARGDLGVEIDVAEIAVAQKRIIQVCREYQRPVIVATQMLESMQHNRQPTRAEATDVANALLDGADACMLSGETAVGEYPLDSVKMMRRIMVATERMLQGRRVKPPADTTGGVHPVTAAVAYGAGVIAYQIGAALTVVATRSGATSRIKSKQRNFIPTLGVSGSEETLRQMCLHWGVIPLRGAPLDPPRLLREYVANWGRENCGLASGDKIVFITGTNVIASAHNVVVVHDVD